MRLPPLQVGSPVAHALAVLFAGDRIVQLKVDASREPLDDVVLVVGHLLAAASGVVPKVLFPVHEEQHEGPAMHELGVRFDDLRIGGDWFGANAECAHLSGGGNVMALQCRAVVPTRRRLTATHLCVIDTRWAPTMLRPDSRLNTGQTLVLSRNPATPTPELERATHGAPPGFWGEPPVELLLATAS